MKGGDHENQSRCVPPVMLSLPDINHIRLQVDSDRGELLSSRAAMDAGITARSRQDLHL